MKKIDIQIAFIDIDWTLYDHKHHKFDKRSIRGLKKLQKQGVKIVICTARPYYSIVEFNVLNHFTPNGIICSCGSVTIFEGRLIESYKMDEKSLSQVVEVCKKHHLCIELVTTYERYYATPKNEYVDFHHQDFFEKDTFYKEYEKEDINTACLFAPKELDETLKKEFPSHIIYSRFGDYGVDILIDRHEKGDAAARLLKKLNISKDTAAAFGDDYTDISMFKAVRYSVAMGNGKEDVKKMAYFVTKPVWKSGIYYFLRKFKLIKFTF